MFSVDLMTRRGYGHIVGITSTFSRGRRFSGISYEFSGIWHNIYHLTAGYVYGGGWLYRWRYLWLFGGVEGWAAHGSFNTGYIDVVLVSMLTYKIWAGSRSIYINNWGYRGYDISKTTASYNVNTTRYNYQVLVISSLAYIMGS